MRVLATLLAVLAIALTTRPAPVAAASAIYYSSTGEAYGWCAGYGYDRAHACARQGCIDSGGTDCQLAVECAGGWGSAAFARDDLRGFGAGCGFGKTFWARAAVLAKCIVAGRALCWTYSTFNNNGGEMSDAADLDFALVWYVQLMLQVRNFDLGDADGEPGPKTRAAVREFQAKIGVEPTGVIDDALLRQLLDATGGERAFARLVKEQVLDKFVTPNIDTVFGYSSAPQDDIAISAEMASLGEERRREAMAILLSSSAGARCTIPAIAAEQVFGEDDETWIVTCAEGTFTLILGDGTRTVIRMDDAPGSEEPADDAPASHNESESSDSKATANDAKR
jgi:peptidoglycan hydrolase-like protein with peptidoglycan-binding domain